MRIVAMAYACEPGEGSEPGAGWAWVRMLARLGEVTVVTRANNRAAIEAGLATTPERDRLHFLYVDLPRRARAWKRGKRGLRLYYLLWQFAALRRMREEHARAPFDLAWHVTLANVWLGSAGGLLPAATFVLGPVGGTVTTPASMLPTVGALGVAQELARVAVLGLARYANPLARLAWRRASLILVNNRETRGWLPRRHQAKAVLFPNPVLDHLPAARPPGAGSHPPTVLFAGRLIPWKGAALALAVVARLPGWRLLVCGQGPDESRLRRLTARLGISDRVVFAGLLPRPELIRVLQDEVDVFLFPSLRDEAPWALAEATTLGVPAVCLARGGGVDFGGMAVPLSGRRATVEALADAVRRAARAPAPNRPGFGLEARVEALAAVLADHGLLPSARVG